MARLAIPALAVLLVAGASASDPPVKTGGVPELRVSSDAFRAGEPLPQQYTCYNVLEPSPPINWSNGPPGTRAYALIMDAPERPGGVGTQWLVYNIPFDVADLVEALPAVEQLANGASQGRNDLGKVGYSAPCPPANVTYVYRFTVYAIDSRLSVGGGASSTDVLAAMDGHILAQGELTATYLRPSWPWG
jgi:hypothetical protein